MSQLSDVYFHSVVVRFWSRPGDCGVIFLPIKNTPQKYLTLVHVQIPSNTSLTDHHIIWSYVDQIINSNEGLQV